jgi:AraC-like DNA-binding protein
MPASTHPRSPRQSRTGPAGNPASEPADAVEFVTDEPERAHDFLRATYVDHTMRITGNTEGFRMHHTHRDAGQFSIDTLAHTMAVEHDNEPLGFLLVGQVIRGQMEREARDATLRLGPGDTFLFSSPDTAFTVRWDTIEMRLTRINLDALGVPTRNTPPRFFGLQPTTPANGRYLASVLNYLADDVVTNHDAIAQPLVVAETTRMLATSVLTSFAHTTPSETTHWSERADAVPGALRRALAFIDAHAHTPITLTDIAAAARVTPRTVQHAFRRYLDTTPTAHLRRVRLDRAHHDLQTAHPTHGDSVTTIAHRWGFTNTGRFTTAYRNIYGQTPRHTLRT